MNFSDSVFGICTVEIGVLCWLRDWATCFPNRISSWVFYLSSMTPRILFKISSFNSPVVFVADVIYFVTCSAGAEISWGLLGAVMARLSVINFLISSAAESSGYCFALSVTATALAKIWLDWVSLAGAKGTYGWAIYSNLVILTVLVNLLAC